MDFMLKLKKYLKLVSILILLIILIIFIFFYRKLDYFILKKINYPVSCDKVIPVWIDDLLPNFKKNGYKGVQLSYRDMSGQKVNCSIGWASLFPLRRLNNKDQMMYASLSKIFTSGLIIKASKENKLSLSDSLLKRLELYHPVSNDLDKIEISHLLEHTAGFDKDRSGDLVFTNPDLCPSHLSKILDLKLDYEPGTNFSYSNFGYCLLGEVIRKSYNRELGSIYEQYLFKPAGVKINHISDTHGSVDYFYKNERPPNQSLMNKNFTAYGGFVGTASDFSEVVSSLLKDSYIKDQMMHYEKKCVMIEFYKCHGLAFYTYKEDGKKLVYWRDGSLPGLSTFFILFEDGSSLVLLANSRGKNPKQDHINLGKKIYRILQ